MWLAFARRSIDSRCASAHHALRCPVKTTGLKGITPVSTAPSPSIDLLLQVRIGFLKQGTTLHGWCREHSIHVTGARQALIGTWNGEKGRNLRKRIVRAAQISAIEATP